VKLDPVGAANGAVVRLYVGDYEARAVPVADTDPATAIPDTFEILPKTPFDFVVNGAGFGSRRFTRTFQPGATVDLKLDLPRNVASTASFQPGPLMAVYYATKSYVLSFSEALHEETRGTGVSVTALCPGPTASGFQAAADMELSPLVANRKLPSAADVAAYGVKAMQRGDAVAVPGAMNKIMAASVRLTPRPVIRRLVRKMQETKPSKE